MRLQADWVTAPRSQAVLRALEGAGHQALFVGGCVRNGLLDRDVSDIDIATDAHPETVSNIAKNAGFHAVPTGIEHGTVTVIVDDVPHEVTTFRKDVATDGRRAVVAFSDDIQDDALRRDFTMNALYAQSDGTVVDPLGGLADLHARRVRFIEDAETRIREDYLRILRFFRFHAWFGDPNEGLDADGLAACAALGEGVESLSKERTGAEMLKLLAAPDPAPSVAAMRSAGVLAHVLPGAEDLFLAPLVHIEAGMLPSSIRRLAVLGGEEVADNLRLSRAYARELDVLRREVAGAAPAAELGYRYGKDTGFNILLLRGAMMNESVTNQARVDLVQGSKAVFPVKAQDLMPEFQGPALGRRLAELEQAWIASGFEITRKQMLE